MSISRRKKSAVQVTDDVKHLLSKSFPKTLSIRPIGYNLEEGLRKGSEFDVLNKAYSSIEEGHGSMKNVGDPIVMKVL